MNRRPRFPQLWIHQDVKDALKDAALFATFIAVIFGLAFYFSR